MMLAVFPSEGMDFGGILAGCLGPYGRQIRPRSISAVVGNRLYVSTTSKGMEIHRR